MSNLTIGKIANNSVTLIIATHAPEVDLSTYTVGSASALNNADVQLTLPNIVGVPHKTWCLCFVESVTGSADARVAPAGILVTVNEMAPQKVYYNQQENSIVGCVTLKPHMIGDSANVTRTTTGVSRTFNNASGPVAATASAIEALTFKEGTTHTMTEGIGTVGNTEVTYTNDGDIINNGIICQSPFGKRINVVLKNLKTKNPLLPLGGGDDDIFAGNNITIKMRLLFLDNEDLKDF